MKIMLIDHRAGTPETGGDCRCYYLALGLLQAGHSAVVVTADFGGGGGARQLCGVDFFLIETPAYDATLTEKGRSLSEFMRRLYIQAPQLSDDYAPDIVMVSTGYPYDFFGAQRIAKRAGAKLIYDIRALWSVILAEKYGENPDGVAAALARLALRRGVLLSDAVTSALPDCAAYFARQELSPARYLYIPEVFVAEDTFGSLTSRVADYLGRIRRNYQRVLLFEGEISAERRLALLLQAAVCRELAGTAVVICGNGGYKIALKRMLKELSAGNVYLMDMVEPAARGALYGYADAVYFGDSRVSVGSYGYTGAELYSVMSSGRAVISCISGEQTPVSLSGCGVNVSAAEPESLAKAAGALLSLSASERRAMGAAGRRFVAENYSPELVQSRFLELVEALA